LNSRAIRSCVLYSCLLSGGRGLARAEVFRSEQSNPVLKITPEQIDFGTQAVGVASQPRIAMLTNVGDRPVTIRDVAASGIDFAEIDKCEGILAPGAQCEIQVTFTPAINGPRMGTIIIAGSGAASPRFLVVTGTGQ
jgi:Transmembrane protein 131-like N-terminal